MIFVTVGTHPGQFDRLMRKIDEIAPFVKEEIIVQRGFTKYIPKNVESFDFTPDLDAYYNKARLVLVQSATSLLEFALKYKKPVITIPRQKKYGEHINDHQVEFGVFFAEKTGIKCIVDMEELTPELLKTYKTVPVIKKDNLHKLQKYYTELFASLNASDVSGKPNLPFSKERVGYLMNLLEPAKKDAVLHVGVSNIPELEIALEGKIKKSVTIDIDKAKIAKARTFLKGAQIMEADITKPLPFPKNSFDKVVILEVLEHLDDDAGALEHISQVMKKGGTLIVAVPNNAFLHYFNPVKYAEHKRHYSNKSIADLLEKKGFTIDHFNLVENSTLLLNLYIHLFFKFVLGKTRQFGTFTKSANKTYGQFNRRGMDIIIKARKR